MRNVGICAIEPKICIAALNKGSINKIYSARDF